MKFVRWFVDLLKKGEHQRKVKVEMACGVQFRVWLHMMYMIDSNADVNPACSIILERIA